MYSQNNHLNLKLKIWMISLMVMITLIILVGGLTRLTDSGLSIITWELFVGIFFIKLYQNIMSKILI